MPPPTKSADVSVDSDPDIKLDEETAKIERLRGDVKHSALANASFLAVALQTWLTPVIWLGNATSLRPQDFADSPASEKVENVLPKMKAAWDAAIAKDPNTTPSVFIIGLKVFWERVLLSGIAEFCFYAINFASPFVIEALTQFFADSQDGLNPPVTRGVWLAILLGCLSWSASLIVMSKFFNNTIYGTRVMTSVQQAVFEKTLTLDPSEKHATTTGEVMNLVSNDAWRMYECSLFMHVVWSSPLAILVTLIVLYVKLGYAAFASVFMMLLLFPFQLLMARLIRANRLTTMKLSDRRIKLVNETLLGIRVVKLYAWEVCLSLYIIIMHYHYTSPHHLLYTPSFSLPINYQISLSLIIIIPLISLLS